MKTSNKYLFMTTMLASTIMNISSNTWMMMWMSMEINMMAFIPLIMKNKNNKSSESCMMYFLIQSISSMMMLFSISMNPMMMNMYTNLMIMALIIKLGAAPFHMWFAEMINKMKWENCLILMTWQKVAPMYVMSNFSSNIIMASSLLSATVGAISGLNQTSVRKIMAFSSINHLGWMMMSSMFDNNMWALYLMTYTCLIWPVTMMFKKNMIWHCNQMMNGMKTVTEKINTTCMMMSMGGMPPMLGFMTKWIVIKAMMNSNMYMLLVLMIMMSLITLFYYMRITMSLMLLFEMQKKWMMKKKSMDVYQTTMLAMNVIMPSIMMTLFI